MEIKEVINYKIYNLKNGTYIDATLKDENGKNLGISVNNFDNYDLTIKLFKLISKKILKEKLYEQNTNDNENNTDIKSENDIKDKFNKNRKKYKRIDSPETVIKSIKNNEKGSDEYQELPSDSSFVKSEGNIEPLTTADFSTGNGETNDNSVKKKEIDLTTDDNDDDGLYHGSDFDDDEDGDFGNDE